MGSGVRRRRRPPQALVSRNNLAVAYEPAEDLGRAIPVYEQTLADSVRVLGADHPQTKIVSGSLARARQHPQQDPASVLPQAAADVSEDRKHTADDPG